MAFLSSSETFCCDGNTIDLEGTVVLRREVERDTECICLGRCVTNGRVVTDCIGDCVNGVAIGEVFLEECVEEDNEDEGGVGRKSLLR